MIQYSLLVIHTPHIAVITVLVIRLENKSILVIHHKLSILFSILPPSLQQALTIDFYSLSVHATVVFILSFKHLHSTRILFTMIIPIAMLILTVIHQITILIILFTITVGYKQPFYVRIIWIMVPNAVILSHTTLIQWTAIHQLHNHSLFTYNILIVSNTIIVDCHRITNKEHFFLHSILCNNNG